MATTVAAVVFDSPMIARIEHRHSKRALVSDVERPILPQIQRYGIRTIGVNRQMMEIDEPVDLVISYPSLIHIADWTLRSRRCLGRSDQAELCLLQTRLQRRRLCNFGARMHVEAGRVDCAENRFCARDFCRRTMCHHQKAIGF